MPYYNVPTARRVQGTSALRGIVAAASHTEPRPQVEGENDAPGRLRVQFVFTEVD